MKAIEKITFTAVISIGVFGTTWWALSATPFAIGIDGYYYAAQVRSYLEKGRFFASDSSWVLYAMVWFSRLGSDIVVMNKIFVALCSVAFFWSVRALMRIFSSEAPALGIAAILLASSYLQFCRTNFIKNFVGLIFFTLLLRQILQILSGSRPMVLTRTWFLLTTGAFLGSAVSHTQTAFLATFTLIVFFYFFMRGQGAPQPHRKMWIVAAAVLLLALLLLVIKNRARFTAVTLSDLFVFDSIFPLQLLKMNGSSPRLAAEAAALMAVNLVFLARYAWFALRQYERPAGDTLIALLIVLTANPFYAAAEAQWGFRLHLVSVVPTALALASMLPLAATAFQRRGAIISGYIVTAAFIAVSQIQLSHNMQANRIDYGEVQAAIDRLSLPDRHLLIAHQGFDYFYCYNRKGDAFHFLAEEKHRGREIFRVLYGFPPVTLRGVKFSHPPIALTRNYTLIREGDFANVKAKLSPLQKKLLFTYRNPTHERDLFLRQRDRTQYPANHKGSQ